jgi:hypothetical protein
MRKRSLILFAIVTVLALGAAVVATRLRAPAPVAEKPLLFPDLRARANDAAEILVRGHDRTITLARDGEKWVVREADGYPALLERVRGTVVGVAELRKLADKTSNPKMFKRLGVEDVEQGGSNSILLRIRDGGGEDLAALIVGRERRGASRAEPPALYVRLPGAPAAMLVEGRVDVSTDPGRWFQRDLFDITPDRVQSIEVAHADGSRVRLARPMQGADLELHGVPKGKEPLSSVVISRMGTVLESFFIEGARAAGNVTLPDDAPVLTVRTFDGIVATLVSARVDDKPMTRIAFAYDPPAAPDGAPQSGQAEPTAPATPAPGGDGTGAAADAAPAATDAEAADKTPDPAGEVEKYSAAVRDWVFQVPQFKFDLLTRRMEDLIRDPTPKGESPIELPE